MQDQRFSRLLHFLATILFWEIHSLRDITSCYLHPHLTDPEIHLNPKFTLSDRPDKVPFAPHSRTFLNLLTVVYGPKTFLES